MSRFSNISASSLTTVDVDHFINERAISLFQWLIVALCGTACFCAGFNLLAPGYLAPTITRDLHLARGEIGLLFVSAGLGTVLGTLTAGPLADRYGRKPVIVAALFLAVPFLTLAAIAKSLAALMIGEFFGTFALMGMVPIAMAMAGEYVPRRWKTTLVMLVFAGFALGTIASGILAAAVLSNWGWHGVFAVDAVLPLAVALLLIPALPESLDVLVRRRGAGVRISRILNHVDHHTHPASDTAFTTGEKAEAGFPVALLFQEGRAESTLLLWAMFFTNMLALFSMNMWLPTILHEANVEEHAAIVIASLMSLGGIFGGIALSELCDRAPQKRFFILGIAYLLGGILIAAIGWSGGSLQVLALVVLLAGCFNFGAQNAANSMVASFYPASMRSTGAAWSMGIGQSAQIFGPLITTLLVALGWQERPTLIIIALPTLIAVIAAAALGARALVHDTL